VSLQKLKEQVFKLPPSDRLELVSAIIESLRDTSISQSNSEETLRERSIAIRQMRGLLRTDQPAPTDEEVAAILEEHRAEKYLQ
jgi:hypothetical protein